MLKATLVWTLLILNWEVKRDKDTLGYDRHCSCCRNWQESRDSWRTEVDSVRAQSDLSTFHKCWNMDMICPHVGITGSERWKLPLVSLLYSSSIRRVQLSTAAGGWGVGGQVCGTQTQILRQMWKRQQRCFFPRFPVNVFSSSCGRRHLAAKLCGRATSC